MILRINGNFLGVNNYSLGKVITLWGLLSLRVGLCTLYQNVKSTKKNLGKGPAPPPPFLQYKDVDGAYSWNTSLWKKIGFNFTLLYILQSFASSYAKLAGYYGLYSCPWHDWGTICVAIFVLVRSTLTLSDPVNSLVRSTIHPLRNTHLAALHVCFLHTRLLET